VDRFLKFRVQERPPGPVVGIQHLNFTSYSPPILVDEGRGVESAMLCLLAASPMPVIYLTQLVSLEHAHIQK